MSAIGNVPIVGVLLANSPSRRICCGDKCMKKLMGKPVLSYVIERALPQVSNLIINANGDPTRFENTSLPIVPDAIEENSSALAGILTGMEWAHDNAPECQWVATFATDSPFIPSDLVPHLLEEIDSSGADMAYVSCGGRHHPEFGLWPIELAEDLRNALLEEKIKRVERWASLYEPLAVEYPAEPIDRFSNTNLIDGIVEIEHGAVIH